MLVAEIVDFLQSAGDKFTFQGDKSIEITGFSTPQQVKDNSVLWVKHADSFDASCIENVNDILVVTDAIFKCDGPMRMSFIVGEHSKRLFFTILEHFFSNKEQHQIGVNSTIISKSIGNNVSIGFNCYIGPNVTIGDGVKIGNNVSIEGKVYLGKDTVIHSGATLGTDGFGFFKDEVGYNKRVPHYGGVTIGKKAEIGSNTSVNRGTLDDTYIGDYVKVGANQLIPHNAVIEANCLILGQIGGSCKIGANTYIAPYSFILNQVKVGKNCMVNINTVVREDVPDGYIVNEKRRIKLDYKLILNL